MLEGTGGCQGLPWVGGPSGPAISRTVIVIGYCFFASSALTSGCIFFVDFRTIEADGRVRRMFVMMEVFAAWRTSDGSRYSFVFGGQVENNGGKRL